MSRRRGEGGNGNGTQKGWQDDTVTLVEGPWVQVQEREGEKEDREGTRDNVPCSTPELRHVSGTGTGGWEEVFTVWSVLDDSVVEWKGILHPNKKEGVVNVSRKKLIY